MIPGLEMMLFQLDGRYYEDLIKECNKALPEYLGGDAIVDRRQVFEDIQLL